VSPLQRWASGEGAPALLEGVAMGSPGGLCLWRHRTDGGEAWVEIRSAEPRIWVSFELIWQAVTGAGLPWLKLDMSTAPEDGSTGVGATLTITGGRHGDQRVIYRLEEVLRGKAPASYLAVWPD
jgi:hypothetical protein